MTFSLPLHRRPHRQPKPEQDSQLQNSTAFPLPNDAPQPSRPLHVVGFWRILSCSAIVIAFDLVTLFLHLALYRQSKPVIFPPCVLGLTAAVLALCSAAVDLRLWRGTNTPLFRRWSRIQTLIQSAICFFSLSAVIFSLTIMTLQRIGDEGKYKSYFDTLTPSHTALATLSFLSIFAHATLGAIVAQLTWWPVHRLARSLMTVSSIFLLAVGTITVAVNRAPFVDCDQRARTMPVVTFTLYQHAGTLISATGILGFAVSTTTKEGNRINALLTRFIHFYILFSSLTSAVCVILIILAIRLVVDSSIRDLIAKATLISDPVLVSTALFLLIINIVAANYLQEPPVSHLAVEPIDLAALTQSQRDAYAALITKHGKQTPGAPSGEAAISVMQAYTSMSLPNMTCTVLRVYRPPMSLQKMRRRDLPSRASSYEDDRAWQHLDEEQMVLREIVNVNNDATTKPPPPKLTKAQQKKLAKKQAAALAKGESIAISPTEPVITPRTLQADLAFTAKLESTEALVLLTTFDDYDLTSSVKGWPGTLLQYTLGQKSFAKPLCVRLGFLAFHWPFRQSTFYCSSARRPVARCAAVLRAITEWNKTLRPANQCAVLLDPTYQHEPAERAIVPSGWLPSPLPASHIVDLRPYKNQTVGAYLKAIKYRDQEAAFKRAGGEVVESGEFGEVECSEAVRLWSQIAEKRVKGGSTAALVTPDENFFMKLGKGSNCARTLMFLRVPASEGTKEEDDTTVASTTEATTTTTTTSVTPNTNNNNDNNGTYHNIASCLLFRLGDTLTSDLQGLDYERARPLKAYFVMMQHVIAIALRDGYSFVDFGPTTAKPKIDIGCKSVPLVAAIYARSPFLSLAIRIAASKARKTLTMDS
jgi:hypothetical protein